MAITGWWWSVTVSHGLVSRVCVRVAVDGRCVHAEQPEWVPSYLLHALALAPPAAQHVPRLGARHCVEVEVGGLGTDESSSRGHAHSHISQQPRQTNAPAMSADSRSFASRVASPVSSTTRLPSSPPNRRAQST